MKKSKFDEKTAANYSDDDELSSKFTNENEMMNTKIENFLYVIPNPKESKMQLLELNKPFSRMKDLKEKSIMKNIHQNHKYKNEIFVLDPQESKMLNKIKKKNKDELIEIFFNRRNHFEDKTRNDYDDYLGPSNKN